MVTIKDNTKKEVIQARQRDLGTKRRNPGRLSGGLCTQGVAYYQPILKALYKSGGSARVRDVLKKLEQSMEGVLKSEDREPLSTGKLRWRETAEWAAIKMKKEGLLKPTSESGHGIWEITEAGRKSLTD